MFTRLGRTTWKHDAHGYHHHVVNKVDNSKRIGVRGQAVVIRLQKLGKLLWSWIWVVSWTEMNPSRVLLYISHWALIVFKLNLHNLYYAEGWDGHAEVTKQKTQPLKTRKHQLHMNISDHASCPLTETKQSYRASPYQILDSVVVEVSAALREAVQ